MADRIVNDITLLFKTKLDEKSKQEVGRNLKGLLENAVIGFDEAETKRNIEPIVRMIQRLFEKAEIAFDADKLLAMPSRQALQEMAKMEVDQLQLAFNRAVEKSGGIKIDFGDMDLSVIAEPLKQVEKHIAELNQKMSSDTKKSVSEIEAALGRLNKMKSKKVNVKVNEDGVEKKVKKEVSQAEQTVSDIERTLDAARSVKSLTTEKSAMKALEKARSQYYASVAKDDPWEIQYQHMVAFVSKYEAMTKKIRPIMDANHPEFKQLYDLVAPKAGAAKISLEHFVDVARGSELSEHKNKPWARESTLQKIEQTLKNGISVKDGGDSADTDAAKESHNPVESDGGKAAKKINTKIPTEKDRQRIEAEQLAEFERKVAEQNKIAAERAQEQAKAQAAAVASVEAEDVMSDAVVADIENRIHQAAEAARQKIAGRSWSSLKYEERDRYADEALRSHFPLYSKLDEDVQAEFVVDLKEFLAGDLEMEDAVATLGRLTMSLEEIYNAAEAEVQQLVRQYAELAGTKKGMDIADQIADEDALISGMIGEDINGEWTRLQDKLLGRSVVEDVARPTPQDVVNAEKIAEAAEREQRAEEAGTKARAEEAGLMRAMAAYQEAFAKTDGKRETAAFINTQTGNIGELFEGSEYAVKYPRDKSGLYDMAIHSHPGKVAAPSVKDLELWFSGLQDITKYGIRAGKELLAFDFSGMSEGDIQSFLQSYRELDRQVAEQFANMSFDEKVAQSLEHGGINEALQVALRRGLERIVQQFPNMMSSIEMPELPVKRRPVKHDGASFVDEYAGSSDDVKALIREYALLEQQMESLGDADYGNLLTRSDEIYEKLPEKIRYALSMAGSEWEEFAAQVAKSTDVVEGSVGDMQRTITTTASDTKTGAVADTSHVAGGSAESKVSIDVDELRALLDSITYKVQVVQDADYDANTKISINADELRGILSGITYNVQSAQDAEQQSRSVSIDEAALEAVLHRVFDNMFGVGTHGEQLESSAEPWALEKTLSGTIKNVLDQIKANTEKIGAGDASSVRIDGISGLATESTLGAIKTAVEEINSKVVKGTKPKSSGGGKSNATKKKEENPEEQEEKREKARAAEERKIHDAQVRAAEKSAKKRAADAKRLAQREAMLGKAGSAVGRAETTWMNAVGIEGVPDSFAAEIDEYYQKLDALRKKHQELKNSDLISEEQKKELIAQTMEINKMTSEIGELVAEYQKLSGDNAQEIGFNTLGANAGPNAYAQQMKQAVMAATNGKAQIKKFDAATNTLTYTVKTGAHEFTEYTAAIRRADGALVSVQGSTKKTETFMEATKRKMKEISSYMSGMAMLSRLGQEFRRGIQYVKDIDLALTELKKVTDETEETYAKFLDTAAKTADKVGSTIQKVVSSTADWARLNI